MQENYPTLINMLIPSQSIALNLQELLVLQEFCNILHIDDEHSHDNCFSLGQISPVRVRQREPVCQHRSTGSAFTAGLGIAALSCILKAFFLLGTSTASNPQLEPAASQTPKPDHFSVHCGSPLNTRG